MDKHTRALTYKHVVELQHCVGLVVFSVCAQRLCSVLTPLRMSERVQTLWCFSFHEHQVSHLCPSIYNTTSTSTNTYSPDEVGAVAAEGRLLEEARDELVVLHFVHVLLPQCALPGEASHAPLALGSRWVGHDGDGTNVVGRNLLDL